MTYDHDAGARAVYDAERRAMKLPARWEEFTEYTRECYRYVWHAALAEIERQRVASYPTNVGHDESDAKRCDGEQTAPDVAGLAPAPFRGTNFENRNEKIARLEAALTALARERDEALRAAERERIYADSVKENLMAERERCAKVVFDELYDGTLPSLRLTDRVCAAIRAGRTT